MDRINILNHESHSGYGVRILHNEDIDVFFLNCTATGEVDLFLEEGYGL